VIPELSIATGSVQFTKAENLSRSVYASNGPLGHVAPNVGGVESEMRNRNQVRVEMLDFH